jgi:hemerythrin-like metal-binding protein
MPAVRNSSSALIEWDRAAFALGVPDMDATHEAFIRLLNRLDAAPNSEFPALFARLLEHTQAHFEDEEARMQRCAFPATTEHSHEHRRILGELAQIRRQVDKGLVSFGRAYVREGLPGWFRLHAATMDSALAAHWKLHSED